MISTSTEEGLKGIVTRYIGAEIPDWRRESQIEDDLGLDSLERVEILMAAEDLWQIEIPDEAAARVHTVGDICDLIDGLRRARMPA